MYDWANSAFMATVVTAVFPIYFPSVAAAELEPAAASFRFAATTFVALSVVAVLAPVLGALADFAGIKKKMLGACLALGVSATDLTP
jgi:UMF1 family MFS transporter